MKKLPGNNSVFPLMPQKAKLHHGCGEGEDGQKLTSQNNGWSLEIQTTLQSDFSCILRHTGKRLWYHSEPHSKCYRLFKYYDSHLKSTGAIEQYVNLREMGSSPNHRDFFPKKKPGQAYFAWMSPTSYVYWVLLPSSNSRKCWILCSTYRWCTRRSKFKQRTRFTMRGIAQLAVSRFEFCQDRCFLYENFDSERECCRKHIRN